MQNYLSDTTLLDHDSRAIHSLIEARGWAALPEYARIGAIYTFVQDEIPLGFNQRDEIPASEVLRQGYGQCNTKATLLMALLRACGIPCRLHACWVDKRLQKGLVNGLFYALTPKRILHSWAEVYTDGRWVALEGVIVDSLLLHGAQHKFLGGAIMGYGIATPDIANPPVAWQGSDTWIQSAALVEDLGSFPSPDALFRAHSQRFTGIKQLAYSLVVRKGMNRNAAKMRRAACPANPCVHLPAA